MKFGTPFWLIALPVVVAGVAVLWIWSARQAGKTLRTAFNTPLLQRLLQSVNSRRRWAKRVLFAIGIGALLLALARPQWGRSEVEIERTGIDLVIALDVSRSMLAADAGRTNRLTVARTALERLLAEMGSDRVGLVVFAGEAFMMAPLTRDQVAIERALDVADPAMVSEQGSNLAEAIKKTRECFDRAGRGPRALLVVSDGEQLQGDSIEAARKALKDGIRVHTAGVGSATGARIPAHPVANTAYIRNAFGREVFSRRDEQQLQRIASAGGGLYTRIEDLDSRALIDWFHRAAATFPRSTEKRLLNEPREQFQWPLAIALMLLAGEWILSERRQTKPHLAERHS